MGMPELRKEICRDILNNGGAKYNEDEIFEIATNAGAKDCFHLKDIHEIISKKEDFYKIKTQLEKKIDTFS